MSSKVLKEQAYHQIRKQILNLEIQPNQRIVEQDLAEQLNISRTPIREAINQLVSEGLVRMVPRKGCYCIFINQTQKDVYKRQVIRNVNPVPKDAHKIGCNIILSLPIQFQCFKTGIYRAASQLLLNPQQLIVFRHPFAPARRAGFDLAGIQRDRQIRNRGIFSLTGSVRYNRCIICFMSSFDRF